MKSQVQTLCVCHSQKPFKQCCDRFLNGDQYPKTAEQLMRSRYSAYALGGYGEYILQTWLPVMAPKFSPIQLSLKEHDWVNLDVLGKGQVGDDAWVEFKAYYQTPDTEAAMLHERSSFKRVQGKWLYVGAEIN